MPVSGLDVALCAGGGLILFSGIHGSSLSDTLRAALTGSPASAPVTEPIDFGSSPGNNSASNPGAVQSGSAMQNYITIANYLVGNGYSKAAAAGICACIAGESTGNPEAEASKGNPSAGAGLIQWTGTNYTQYKPAITGNASADLQQQLPLIIEYNNAQGSQYISMLNQFSDPVEAADFYSQYFERPAVKNSDVVASVATQVYAQITKGSTTGTTSKTGSSTQYTSPNGYSY